MESEFTIEVPSGEAQTIKGEECGNGSTQTLSLLADLERQLAQGEPLAPTSNNTSDVPAPNTQATDVTPQAPIGLAAAMSAPTGLIEAATANVAAQAAANGSSAAGPADFGAAPAAAGDGPAGEEDELAANLLSNMAAWQTELDTFQAALRECMESRPVPGAIHGSPSTVDETGRGAARLMHSGPKGITGFRGVTQHKRTKRYEANVWMDHKQMYLGAFDSPEQAAHAHDIGALCSGKARTEALNFPLTDYDSLMPMLYSLPHAQVVAALRSYGRLPTARPPGGISSGRLFNSPSARSGASSLRRAASAAAADTDDSDDGTNAPPRARPRRLRKVSASPGSRSAPTLPPLPPASPMDWQAALRLSVATGQQQQQQLLLLQGIKPDAGLSQPQQQQQQGEVNLASLLAGGPWPPMPLPELPAAAAGADSGAKADTASVAAAQQAQLQALSAALMGNVRPSSALSGAEGAIDTPEQPPAVAAPTPALPAAPAPTAAAPATQAPAPAAPRPPLPGVRSPALMQPATSLPIPEGSTPLCAFEDVLWRVMASSHQLARPDDSQEGAAPRPLHSGPKGQSGYKGVTLYKRCQRYNAHIWLGKQTHIGTFHTAEQAAVAHDVMELWRNDAAQGLNFSLDSYGELLPLLKTLSEADALAALRNYSRSPSAAAAAAASGNTANMPGRSRLAGMPRPSPSAGGSTKSAPAFAAAATASTMDGASLVQPSLRRRQRKPQHGGGGGGSGQASGAKSDSSSGGSVPAQRQTAGSLMWYMLEQERSADEGYELEEGDPDFSPEDAAEELDQASKRQRNGSPAAEALPFQPQSTASVVLALSTELPPDQSVVGARPPRPGSSHRWGVAVSLRGQSSWFGRLDRQRAAVAADLVLLWRRCCLEATGEEDDKDAGSTFNVPFAGYEQDAALMEQLRRIKTAVQLCQFLAAVIPQDPLAANGTAAAASTAPTVLIAVPGARLQPTPAAPAPLAAAAPHPAAAVPSVLLGARKRKQQALLEEAQAAKMQQASASLAAPAAGALPGAPKAAATNGSDAADHLQGLRAHATAVMQQADVSDADSMLAALRLLVAAGEGGKLLQELVANWSSYPLMQQQDFFSVLKQPISLGDWDHLEGRLQVALDLASLF